MNKPPYFLLSLIIFLTCLTFFQFLACQKEKQCTIGEDFILFYRAAGDAAAHRPVYKVDSAKTALEQLRNHQESDFHPFLYPPQSLLLIAPLALLSYSMAWIVWVLVPLAFLMVVTIRFTKRNVAAASPYSYTNYFTLSTLFLPFLMVNFVAGQNGAFWTACFVGVMLWRHRNPWLAGILLALLSSKPQLGIFLPLLLLYEKNWRVLLIAAASVLLMMLAATSLWGSESWKEYAYVAQIFSAIQKIAPEKYVYVSASPYMAMRMLGFAANPAYGLQLVLSLATLVLAWKQLSKCKNEDDRIILLALATFLFSPYSYIYDTLLLVLPCALIIHDKNRRIAFLLLIFIPIIAVRMQFLQFPYCFMAISFAFIQHIYFLRRTSHG